MILIIKTICPGIGCSHLFEAVDKLTDTGNKSAVNAFIEVLFFIADEPWLVKGNEGGGLVESLADEAYYLIEWEHFWYG